MLLPDHAAGIGELVYRRLREERRVDGNHDHDLVVRGAQSGDDAGDRRADIRPVVEKIERKLEPVGALADRERLRRAEARTRAPDEQDARQLPIRHASV